MNKFLDRLFAAVELIVKALLAGMIILVSCQVLLRGTVGRSIKWSEEVSLIFLMWLTFLVLALGIRYDIHIRISMFVAWLPKSAKQALEYLVNLVLLFICVMMIYYGWRLSGFAMRSTLPATKLPTAVMYGIVPIAGCIGLIQIVARLLGLAESAESRRFIEGIEYAEDEENISQ